MTAGKVDGGSGNVATASSFALVTPHDSNQLSSRCRGLWVNVAGNVTVTCPDTGVNVTFVAGAGAFLPIQVDVVRATSTTATGIIALY